MYRDKIQPIGNELLAALEAERLSAKYNKDFLDCEDLVRILGVGRDNVRALMNSRDFPTIKIGNRKVVSVMNFAAWLVKAHKPEVY